MITGGSAYYELLRDYYRPQGGKWVKMSKEEAKVCDNVLNTSAIFASVTDYSSNNSNYSDDFDEFENDENGHAFIPFKVRHPLELVV